MLTKKGQTKFQFRKAILKHIGVGVAMLLLCRIILVVARGTVEPSDHELHVHMSQDKKYHPSCKWVYNETKGGYPPIANNGREDLVEYVCPSMFRDMSDYVYQWPYEHFGEHDVWVADPALAAENLPPVSDYNFLLAERPPTSASPCV